MIQRIQSLLLLAAVICSLLMLLIPCFYLEPVGDLLGEGYKITLLRTTIFDGNTERELLKNWPLFILNTLLSILYIGTIFDYRKRLRQIKTCQVIFLFQIALILLLYYQWKQLAVIATQHVFAPGWGIAFLVTSIVFVSSARYFILKD